MSLSVEYLVGVNMYPPQILYFTIALSLVVGLATYISLIRPWGSTPATYGHLQTIMDFIDDPHPRMFWGHKEDGEYCYAGTSSKRLPQPIRGMLYGGTLRSNAMFLK